MIKITKNSKNADGGRGIFVIARKGKPELGLELKRADKIRIALALELLAHGQVNPSAKVGRCTALKIASVIYPVGLKGVLPQALQSVPLPIKAGQYRTDKHIKGHEKRELWASELDRLKKALKTHQNRYVPSATPRPLAKGDWRARVSSHFEQLPADSWLAKVGSQTN